MYVPTADKQNTTAQGLRGLVARHPATAFVVMVFGFGWTGLIPILLSENGFGVLPIELPLTVVQTLVTVLGLAVPAFLVTAATGGTQGARDLLSRLFRWRVGVHWYLIALFGLPVAMLLVAIPFLGVAPLEALAQKWGLLLTVFLPGVVLPFLHTNLWEELGWMGFLQSTLQERRGPLLASLMVAPVFALFHLPAYFVAGWIVDNTPRSVSSPRSLSSTVPLWRCSPYSSGSSPSGSTTSPGAAFSSWDSSTAPSTWSAGKS